MDYTGYIYIYIWWDTKENLYYVGGHKGSVSDKYTCSNTMLKGILNRRKESVRFRVLEYVYGNNENLREIEQKWLRLIKAEELYLGAKPRYYNLKKLAAGGNGSANRGNSNIGGHNRKDWKITSPSGESFTTDSLPQFCNDNNLIKSTNKWNEIQGK